MNNNDDGFIKVVRERFYNPEYQLERACRTAYKQHFRPVPLIYDITVKRQFFGICFLFD